MQGGDPSPGTDPDLPDLKSLTSGKTSRSRQQRKAPKRGYLDGQMLIAMPTMGDDRFARSVIYVCAHSTDGAMGIIVNQPAEHISFPDLLVQLDVIPAADLIQLPMCAGDVKVLKGGPVDTQRGFVLHSSRLLHRELDAADRRGHLPHRHARHPQGDRARRRTEKRDPRARLCRLGAGPARERDPAQRLAALLGRFRACLRRGHRRQIRQGAEEDRRPSRHAFDRGRPRLVVAAIRAFRWDLCRRLSPPSLPARANHRNLRRSHRPRQKPGDRRCKVL